MKAFYRGENPELKRNKVYNVTAPRDSRHYFVSVSEITALRTDPTEWLTFGDIATTVLRFIGVYLVLVILQLATIIYIFEPEQMQAMEETLRTRWELVAYITSAVQMMWLYWFRLKLFKF